MYKKKAVLICTVELLVVIIFLLLGIQSFAMGVHFALIMAFLLTGVEKIFAERNCLQ